MAQADGKTVKWQNGKMAKYTIRRRYPKFRYFAI